MTVVTQRKYMKHHLVLIKTKMPQNNFDDRMNTRNIIEFEAIPHVQTI